MKILGVETSCDDTCVAVVDATGGMTRPRFSVRANAVSSQVKTHAPYGGVVPSLAAREHTKNFVPVLKRALRDARCDIRSVDLLAVTTHPGLMPALLIGVHAARTLSWALKKPILGIDHLKGHIAANLLPGEPNAQRSTRNAIRYPAIGLIVSGGHTQIVLLKNLLDMRILGETRDDAAGEAFDKVAKLLSLPFPGGPPVAELAARGNAKAFDLPRPMIITKDFDFSFSGLKTAVLYLTRALGPSATKRRVNDICASFQQAVVDVLVSKTVRASQRYHAKTVLLGGGVAANTELREQLGAALALKLPNTLFRIPSKTYALDNAAMIAVTAYLQWQTLTPTQHKRATWKNVRVLA